MDFSRREEVYPLPRNSGPPLRAAVSAMVSPEENFSYYSRIFDYISHKIGRKQISRWGAGQFSLGLILFLFSLSFVQAQGKNPLEGFSIKGKAYFDYSYLLSSSGPIAEDKGTGWNDFKFRRAYFTMEHQMSERFKFRFRPDSDRNVDDKSRVFMKHVYLEWKKLIPDSKLYIGLSPTPTKELSGKKGTAPFFFTPEG